MPGSDCAAVSPITAAVPAGYTLSESVAPAFDCNSISLLNYTELNRNVIFGFAPLAPTPTAHGTPGTPTQAAITPTAAAAETPGLSITSLTLSPQSFTGANQKINIKYAFTNTGNVELSGKFDIGDLIADAGTITCTQNPASIDLLPQQSVTCTASHTTTSTDVSNGLTQHPLYEKVTVSTVYKEVPIQASQESYASYARPSPKEGQPTQAGATSAPTQQVPTPGTPTG